MINGFITEQELFEGPLDPNFNNLNDKQKQRAFYKHQSDLSEKVRRMMIGSLSGLNPKNQDELARTLGFLHSHVHRAESTQWKIIHDSIDQKPISLLPIPDELSANYFITISSYACWAITRILPFLSQPVLYSKQWKKRYEILDLSFHDWVSNEAIDLDEAFLKFMSLRMSFGRLKGVRFLEL
jgi:hypothetical protein